MVSSKFRAASGNDTAATVGSWRVAGSSGRGSTLNGGIELSQKYEKMHTASDYSGQERMV